jgi:hypothetical protein
MNNVAAPSVLATGRVRLTGIGGSSRIGGVFEDRLVRDGCAPNSGLHRELGYPAIAELEVLADLGCWPGCAVLCGSECLAGVHHG